MSQILTRFLIGGAVVSVFAIIGDLLKPKSFAGLFGAAPSVALATLGLTAASEGVAYAATEARSMVAGCDRILCLRFFRQLGDDALQAQSSLCNYLLDPSVVWASFWTLVLSG